MVADDIKTEEDDYVPSGVQEIFAKKRLHKAQIDFISSQPRVLKWAMFCGALLIIAVYFSMPSSCVKSVSVSGNINLPSEYIKVVSNVDTSHRFFLTVPFITELRLKSNPMIQDAKVSLNANHVVSINITEKKAIGYRYDSDEPTVILADHTTASLDSGYLGIIANIPLITGFDDEDETKQLCSAFADVETSVIADISEISQYKLPYDDQTLKILMRTGGYFVSNYHDLYMINQYHLVEKKVTDSSKCVFAFSGDTGDTVYTRTCPWNETASETEYWTDASGNVIKNSYGDQIAKHYYTDSSGSDALDSNGKKIPIPIDSSGTEVLDAKFQEHYEAGYYAAGTLILPEGAE